MFPWAFGQTKELREDFVPTLGLPQMRLVGGVIFMSAKFVSGKSEIESRSSKQYDDATESISSMKKVRDSRGSGTWPFTRGAKAQPLLAQTC